eukprot:13418216-Heterocapsa_arctica.AAC.1
MGDNQVVMEAFKQNEFHLSHTSLYNGVVMEARQSWWRPPSRMAWCRNVRAAEGRRDRSRDGGRQAEQVSVRPMSRRGVSRDGGRQYI